MLAAALALGLSGQASAQALSCTLPAVIPTPRPAGPSADEPIRQIPTASYTLAVTWTPQYCRGRQNDGSFRCGGDARFGMTLHGLWPDGPGRQWPQYCAAAEIVPETVVRDMLCATPSANLIQHEWAKHGTCGWQAPAAYFATSRRLYQDLRFPDFVALSRQPNLTVSAFRRAFAAANRSLPGFTAASINVRVTRDGWLDELWLCLDRRYRYTRCRDGGEGGRTSSQRLQIWRGALSDR